MSDKSQGPGWWQASDDKWYPPAERPADWWLASDGKWYPPQSVTPLRANQQVMPAKQVPVAIWLSFGGAAALVLGALMPWATIGALSVNGTNGDGILTLFAGVIIAVLAFVGRSRREQATDRGLGVAIVVTAFVAAAIGIYDFIDIDRGVSEGPIRIDASPGIGLYLTILGAGAALVGGMMLMLNRTRPTRGENVSF
jgi:hypothetical protein